MNNKFKKVDMHVHSIYSERPSEWILKTIGTRESYIDPFDLYNFAKERGMDFVTITDHNKIDGILKLKEKNPDDTFIGVEVTTYFPEDNAKIHILLYDFEPSYFEKINDIREDIYKLREFVYEKDIFYSVAHPIYSINNKLNISHIEKLILLFDNFEVINGGRNIEVNSFTKKLLSNLNEEKIYRINEKYKINTYSKTPWKKNFTAGSDDHTGLFIGTSYCYSCADNINDFIKSIKEGNSNVEGKSLDFETHAFQIFKITVDFYKSKLNKDNIDNNVNNEKIKNSKVVNSNLNNDFNVDFNIIDLLTKRKKLKDSNTILKLLIISIDKVLFEKKHLTLKEKYFFNKIRTKAIKNDDKLKKEILELVLNLDKVKFCDPYEVSKTIFNTISNIVDNYVTTFVKTLTEKLDSNNLSFIIGKISSILIPIIFSAPYLSSILHLWKDRDLIYKLNREFQNYDLSYQNILINNNNKNINSEKLIKDKKIAWFTDTLFDLNGVSVTLRNIGEYAYRENRDLYFITSLFKQDLETKKFNFNLINFEPIFSFSNDIYKHYEVKIPSVLNIIKNIYELNPDEIIISTPGPIGLIGMLASKILSIPNKMIFHTDFAKEAYEIIKDETLSGIVDYLLKLIYNIADEILVNTNEYKRILIEKGYNCNKIKLFKRGIDLNKFCKITIFDQNILNTIDYKKDDFILLYTGRISKDKNLDFIINVFDTLRKNNTEIKLLIVGDGPYKDELERKYDYLKNIGLYFLGNINNEILPQFYSLASLFVFPSTTDTFGMSVLEAQACGLPAIVSNLGGPKEIVIDKLTGYVLKIDQRLWIKMIEKLIFDKKNKRLILNQLSMNSIINIRKKYNIKNIVKNYFIWETDDFDIDKNNLTFNCERDLFLKKSNNKKDKFNKSIKISQKVYSNKNNKNNKLSKVYNLKKYLNIINLM